MTEPLRQPWVTHRLHWVDILVLLGCVGAREGKVTIRLTHLQVSPRVFIGRSDTLGM
jgi:hypothetical protein